MEYFKVLILGGNFFKKRLRDFGMEGIFLTNKNIFYI